MKYLLMWIIRGYRKFISPCFPPSCRFTPTCSEYALQALGKHGFIKGTILAVWRILRCNPFCRGGDDPVPERFTLRRQNITDEKETAPGGSDSPQRKEMADADPLKNI